MHLYNGVYYDKDEKKALEVYPGLKTEGLVRKLKVLSGMLLISASFIGSSYFIYKLFNRNK